ncbi:MAG TPA: aldo/keto reductase [Acidimicrobiales bacterium]|nr:aldo/keto reductase [Acidimicrobiales bacterium]
METRSIGSLTVSRLGLGCNDFGMTRDEETVLEIVHAALDAGITYFDTADVYGGGDSERFLGKALKSRRSEVIIATKFGTPGTPPGNVTPGSAVWIERAVESSLIRLDVDYIDHYQIHYFDPLTPLDETMDALDHLVKSGKVRELGCANFGGTELKQSFSVSDQKKLASFRSLQSRYNVIYRQPELDGSLAACGDQASFIPFFPLENGILTGKYRNDAPPPADSRQARWDHSITSKYFSPEKIARATKLVEYAAERGRTGVELALGWLAVNPTISTIIAGASRPDQVVSNSQALGWEFTESELREIDEIAIGDLAADTSAS